MTNVIQQSLYRFLLGIVLLLAPLAYSETMEKNYSMGSLEQIPYGFKEPNGKVRGILFDIMNEIIKQSGLSATNLLLPPKRLINELTRGVVSCSLLADTHYAQMLFDIIEPIGLKLPAGILPKKGVQLPNYEGLKNITIAIPLGIYFDDIFDKDEALTKVHPPQYLNSIRMLKYGRVDAVAGAIPSLLYIAKNEGMTNRDFGTPLILSNHEVNLTCRRSVNNNVREAMQTATKKLKKSGTIQGIIMQHPTFISPP